MEGYHHDYEDELIEVCIICNVRGEEAIEACPCEIKRTIKYSTDELVILDRKWSSR